MARRDWFLWHSWLGLTAGLMLFVICWSGTFAVLSYEIDWALNPDLRAETMNGPVPYSQVYDAVRAEHPDWQIREINAPRYPGFAMQVLAEVKPRVLHRVYVDPVSFKVMGDTSYMNVQRFFRSFHMSLFQANFFSVLGIPIGYFTVVVFVFPLLVSMVTPLLFYKRWWRGFFKLETRKGAKVFWSDAHKLTGLWSLWFVAIICLTCLWYLAEWFMPFPPTPTAPDLATSNTLEISTLVEKAQAAFPELDIRSLRFFSAENNIIYAEGQDGTLLTRGRAFVALDMRTGEALEIYHQGRSGLIARLKEMVDVLHFGTFTGLWSQFLYFVFGIFLSGLVLSGAYLQAQRQARRHGLERTRHSVLAAYAATVALLAMAVAAGWIEITGFDADGGWPKMHANAVIFVVAWIASTLAALSIWMAKLR